MTTETIVAFLQTYNGVMLLATAVAIIAMEWAGRKGSLLLIYYAFGRKAAINYDTRWTAVGVIFHELSHLLFAFFTGAKIEGFRLYRFKRSEDDGVLGYVNYVPRGFFLMRTVQNTLTGIAPALLGSANVCLLGWALTREWQSKGMMAFNEPTIYVLAFFMSQIAYHACPSSTDIKGSWISIAVFALLVAGSSFRYFSFELGMWVIKTVGMSMLVAAAPAAIVSIVVITLKTLRNLQRYAATLGRY